MVSFINSSLRNDFVSMALSAIVALRLTPALCALLLKLHDKDEVKVDLLKFIHKFNVWFANTLSKYVKNVENVSVMQKSQWPFCWLWLFYWAG